MLKRTICMLLSITLLMGSFGIMYIHAENDSEQTIQAVSPEAVEATTTASTPEVINITSGSVLLELGKTYQLVHDNVDIVNLYSFSSAITIMGTNTIRADEIGSTYLSIGYYNDNNVLSLLSCQIEILDISGTIDLAKSNVFVEKGKNYWLIHSEETPSSISTMNHNIINFTNGVRVLVAVDTGTTNLAYNYTKDGSNVSGVCKVDVYEALDIDSYKTSSADNFYLAMSRNNAYGDTRYALTLTQGEISAYPIIQWAKYSRYETQEFSLIPTSGNYFKIYSTHNSLYLTVSDSEITLDSEILFSNNTSSTVNYINEWKLLVTNDTSLILVPKGAETAQVFLSISAGTSLQSDMLLSLRSYTETNIRFPWEIYNSNIYINNYYDNSLNDEVGVDLMVVNSFFSALNFANVAFKNYFPSMEIKRKLNPTLTPDSPADKCTSGVDNPCDNTICGSSHLHKRIDQILKFARTDLPRMNNEITVLWSDRSPEVFCEHTESTCTTCIASGLHNTAQNNESILLILSIRKHIINYFTSSINQNDLENFTSLLLTHELFHIFGLSDNYYRASHKLAGETEYNDSISCVMEASMSPSKTVAFYNNVALGYMEPLCDDCYNDWEGKNDRYGAFLKGINN